jgi:hypothetical protein
MTEIKSSSQVAQSAVSGFSDATLHQSGETVHLSVSNLSSMQEASVLANSIFAEIGTVVEEVKAVASKIPKIAAAFEEVDSQGAAAISATMK